MNPKQVQMPFSFMVDVYKLILRLESLQDNLQDEVITTLRKTIQEQIECKLKRIERHNIYTQSKSGKTEVDREIARQKYLDMAGIHPDWRYNVGSDNKTII